MSVAGELRRPVYRSVASQAVDYQRVYDLMQSVRFDPKELMSQHSHYVDVMLQVSEGREEVSRMIIIIIVRIIRICQGEL